MKIIQLRVAEAGRGEKTYPVEAWDKAMKNYALTSIAGKRPVFTVVVEMGEIVVYATGGRIGAPVRSHLFYTKPNKGQWKSDEKRPRLVRYNYDRNAIVLSSESMKIQHEMLRFAMHDRMKVFAITTRPGMSVYAESLLWFWKTELGLEVTTQGPMTKARLKKVYVY